MFCFLFTFITDDALTGESAFVKIKKLWKILNMCLILNPSLFHQAFRQEKARGILKHCKRHGTKGPLDRAY